MVIGLAHIREARAEGVQVGAAERVWASHPHQTDMIGDEHQVAGEIVGMDGTGSVGHHKGLNTQPLHHAHGQSDLLHGVAFIIMNAPLHHKNGLPFQLANEHAARVTGNCGDRPIGNFAEGDAVGSFNSVCQAAQTRAQDDANSRLIMGAPGN